MIKGFRQFRKKSLRNTLVLFNAFIIVFVITMVSYSGQYYYQQQFEKRELEQIMHLQRQVQLSFDERLHSIEQSISLMLKDEKLIQAFDISQAQSLSAGQSRLDQESALRHMMKNYSEIYPEYLNILLTDANGEVYYSNDAYRLNQSSFRSEQWFTDATQKPNQLNYYFHSAIRNLASWRQYSDNNYISFSKAILSPIDGKTIGVVLLDINLEPFKQEYSELVNPASAFLFFMNNEGQVVLSPENGLAYRVRPSWFEGKQQGIMQSMLEGQRYNIFFQRSEDFDLVLVSLYDAAFLEPAQKQFQITSLVIGFIALSFALLWSLYYLSEITNPLSKLSVLMKRAEDGELDVSFRERCVGEIEALGESFNQMLQRIRLLMDKNKVTEEEKREAEIRILQEQLKPHFLYNTLDTIVWMARKDETDDIIHFTKALSSFYRVALSGGAEYIPLQLELDLIRNYMEVQMVRYPDLFSFEIDCPEHLLPSEILHMILQPLVENAIYHGFKETEPKDAKITITVTEEEGLICIKIEDNGVGLSEDEIISLNYFLNTGEGSSVANYGLINVYKRLALSQGEGPWLQVEKAGTQGLCVILRYRKR